MKSRFLTAGIVAASLITGGVVIGIEGSPAFGRRGAPELNRFASARAFERYLDSLRRRRGDLRTFDVMEAPPPPMEMAMPSIESPSVAFEPSAGAPANPAITNNQTFGVDEGGIVKQVGHYLVVLQDGRLFSADLGDGPGAPLRLADRIDVYRSPETAASWYDEMLVLGDRILVTAYNYNEQASEITIVRIDEAGRMRREGRFLLSSSDYYSTDNYATRLVGDNLVFYAPLPIDATGPDGRFAWPRLRRADGDGAADRGEALIGPTDVYAPPGEIDDPVLHTLSVCPLRREARCRTTAFVGPPMRELYVSPTDAFVWIGAPDGQPWSIDYAGRRRQACPAGKQWNGGEGQSAIVYRLPLDGGPIGAIAADGIPADQFAFDGHDGRFRALLARTPAGCIAPGEGSRLALLDVPLSVFAGRVARAGDGAYADVPSIAGGQIENRFIGHWLVYGGRSIESGLGEAGGTMADSSLFAVPLGHPRDVTRLVIPHNAIRIERAGGDAVVTGYRDSGGLSLSYVSLGGRRPAVADTERLDRRFESEGRSHAFNAWVRPDGSGMIGLPTSGDRGRGERGWSDSQSSELSFVAISPDKRLHAAGELAPRPRGEASAYRCLVSCIDWYGNSRPVFTGGRIFALMGTDLVEGQMARGRIGEVGRLDLTGAARVALR